MVLPDLLRGGDPIVPRARSESWYGLGWAEQEPITVVQVLTVTTLTSMALSFAQACASVPRDEAPSAETAFVLMGDPARGWFRPGAGAPEFKREARYCLDHSADARAEVPEGADEAGAGFETFHGCMESFGWGPPPKGTSTQLVRPHETLPQEHYHPWST